MPFPKSLRQWGLAFIALAVAALAYYAEPVVRPFILHDVLGVHSTRVAGQATELALWPFTVFLIVRLAIYAAALGLLCAIPAFDDARAIARPKRPFLSIPMGLGTGILVMSLTILAIVATGAAHLDYAGGSPLTAAGFGLGWLVNDIIGAAGEEILFRGLIFVALSRVGGKWVGIVGSALAFSLDHGANPGASVIWMVRLFAQGLLLAYAVVRTRSLFWSIAYHAGWNWASAPLFGAVGSGFTDQGHVMTMVPTGSSLITGGDVGPEGSLFAFVAVLLAGGLLLLTLRKSEAAP